MAARSIASLTISFGLVSIPVKLFSATEASRAISFNLLHKACGSRLKQQYLCIKEEIPVAREDMVKGYEFAKDQYVVFTPEELKAMEEAGTGMAEITEFVPIEAIDPVYFDKAYYLAPDKGGAKPFALLHKALAESERCALGRWAARGKQYIVMIRPVEDGLIMQQLLYAGEVRSIKEIEIPATEVKPAELKLAKQLIEAQACATFDPSQYTDQVSVERSGGNALAALSAGSFDAIASDISLPDMSGLDVIARARAISPASGIVAITGFVDVDVAVRSMKAGADDFLGKPFDPDILWHMLNKAVDNRGRRIEADQAAAYRQLAYTDALTGCPNRRFIDEFIVDAVNESVRDGRALVAAYLDIDNFKLLNDFVGHEQGDHVLKRVVRALSAHITEPAVFARFGGDEFVVIFPGTTEEEAHTTIERVRTAVSHIEVVNGSRVTLPTRISCGIARFRGYETPRDLIAEAEEHMYLDKAGSTLLVRSDADDHNPPEALLKITNLKALRSLVKAIDRRDSYTRFHSDHATLLATTLGRHLGLNDEHMSAITIGGPIHDLGKIVVPDEILRKPGPLTSAERRAMEEHPVMGAAIAAAVTDYDTVVELVRHHHERFDGEGYPGRLKREEISLSTRIFSLADAYSAMTTDRPYRKGLTVEQAVAQIVVGSGTQFDPDLAREFVALVEREYGRNGAAA